MPTSRQRESEKPSADDLVREFYTDVMAAYGSQGQEDSEIDATLAAEWLDLSVTFARVRKYLEGK